VADEIRLAASKATRMGLIALKMTLTVEKSMRYSQNGHGFSHTDMSSNLSETENFLLVSSSTA
jgi:hypothetical protein